MKNKINEIPKLTRFVNRLDNGRNILGKYILFMRSPFSRNIPDESTSDVCMNCQGSHTESKNNGYGYAVLNRMITEKTRV